MRTRLIAPLAAALAAGCGGGGGPVELDIEGFDIAFAGMLPAEMTTEAEAAELEINVRAGQLRRVLGRGGVFDLSIFACAAPQGPAETYPVYFGSEPITALRSNPVDDDPDMLVRLAAPVPMRTLEMPGRCARFVGRPGSSSPDILSPIVPLTRDEAEGQERTAPPPMPLPPEIAWPGAGNDGDGDEATAAPPPPPPVTKPPMPAPPSGRNGR